MDESKPWGLIGLIEQEGGGSFKKQEHSKTTVDVPSELIVER